jgi:hypothetical protein
MPWTILYHKTRPEKPQTGDMWPAPWLLKPGREADLSDAYRAVYAGKRPPLIVRLPGGAGDFCVDGDYGGEIWTVTGEAPNITVSPSIHAPGLYHGWLENGVLSDDGDVRVFPT